MEFSKLASAVYRAQLQLTRATVAAFEAADLPDGLYQHPDATRRVPAIMSDPGRGGQELSQPTHSGA